MRVIARSIVDLQTGLARARELEARLQSEWQPHLQRWERLREQALPRHRAGTAMILAGLVVVGLLCLGMLCAYLSQPNTPVFHIAILLFSFLPFVLVLLGAREIAEARKIARGLPLNKKLPVINSLTARWWQQIEEEARALDIKTRKEARDGAPGEILLLDVFKKGLPNSYFGVRGVKSIDHLDADVLVIGPTGLWVLESKYWNGTIRYAGGEWTQQRDYPGEQPQPRKEIDRQWRNECAVIRRLLKEEMPHWRIPLDGGLAFTHHAAHLEISGTSPVPVDTPAGWVRRIRAAPPRPGMDERTALQVLDVLLTHSLTYTDDSPRSSTALAENLYAYQVKELMAWRSGGA